MSGANGDAELGARETAEAEEVAVVAMAGRFPGATDCAALWRNLRDGVESISTFDDDQLLAAGVPPERLGDRSYVRARGIVAGAELFDAGFFGFSPREAALTDPQHRLFLECAWEALEQAGVDPDTHAGRIGVYAGTTLSTYLLFHLLPRWVHDDETTLQVVLANDKDTLATRVSYKLNLRGPSLSVQTACSTSLVAVHLARQSLLDYECDLALAGGVSVRSPQTVGYSYRESGILSPDGHCRAFAAGARGTVFSSGAGIVVLKRLGDALAGGDTVRAVIKSSAINNDGRAKVGFTAPSVEGQAEVVARAMALAGIDPDSVQVIEAHGSGTPIGDPIEIAALTSAFRGARRRGFCAVGSVKTNLGHLDPAAGIAGLIKTVLALEHRQIPPSLHCERPNPEIDFAGGPFYVNDRLRPWEVAGGGPRRAGVNSFGIGGTNAHVIVEEAPPPRPTSASRPWQLLLLSARSEAALAAAGERLAEHLRLTPEQDLADVAYTLQVGRRAFPWRRAWVAGSREEALSEPGARPARRVDGPPALAFLFPGHGTQRPGMGLGLYRSEAVFRGEVDRASALLEPHLGEDLRALLWPAGEGPGRREEAERRLRSIAVAQPALFVLEAALARLWISWGVRPQALLGHGLGEYVAAHLAGVMSLADALALVAVRARLVEQLPPAAMLALPLPASDVTARLRPELELALAAVNAPAQCVVSGPEPEIERLRRQLAAEGIEGLRLGSSHASHSRHVETVVEPFARQLRQVVLRPPEIPLLSNLTGSWVEAAAVTDPSYWVRHLSCTVRFGDGLAALLEEPSRMLLEVGPGRTLTGLAQWHREPAAGRQHQAIASLDGAGGQGEGCDEALALGAALARLWQSGVEVDWAGFYAGERRRRVPLPTYPFERQRHWIEPARPGSGREPGAGGAETGRPAAAARPAGGCDLPAAPAADPPAPPPAPPAARTPQEELAPDPVSRRIAEIWRQVLGVDRIGPADCFFDLGGDSLVGMQVLDRLRESFAVELPADVLFESTTVPALRAAVEEALLARLEALPEEEAQRLAASLSGAAESQEEPSGEREARRPGAREPSSGMNPESLRDPRA
jgi:phthiocerol/phenolphthiocerol synthesis type-I polyketide synthase E